MNEGWIKISRGITENWIWKDPVKLKWWIDMLITVNFKDAKVNLGNQIIECKRGQSVMSLKTWANRWIVDKNKVRNFFILLQKDKMITIENIQKSTRITICNYDSYQGIENVTKTQPKRNQNAIETQSNTIEEGEEEKRKRKEKESMEIEFNEVWTLYKKKGNRKASFDKYKKLSEDIRLKIKNHVPSYVNSVNEIKFIKNFETYLNQEHWENEIVVNKDTPKQPIRTASVQYHKPGDPLI